MKSLGKETSKSAWKATFVSILFTYCSLHFPQQQITLVVEVCYFGTADLIRGSLSWFCSSSFSRCSDCLIPDYLLRSVFWSVWMHPGSQRPSAMLLESTNLIQLLFSGHTNPFVFETYLSSSYSNQQILFKISFHFKSVYQETGGLRIQCSNNFQAFCFRIKEWDGGSWCSLNTLKSWRLCF